MLFLSPAVIRLKRALARDQRRPVTTDLPLWRLLVGEIGVLARRVGRTRVAAVAIAVMVAVALAEAALSDLTPGPVLAAPWRWLIAAVAAALFVLGWAARHALRRTDAAG